MLTTILLAMITAAETTAEQAEDLSVVAHLGNYNDEMLFEHIMNIAEAQYQKRDEALAQLKTVADWKQRQEYVREKLLEMIGGFPELTPLNPRIVGTLEYEDYRIEKLIFESRPQFYVTANVYVPKNRPTPMPAVLGPCGHTNNGKAAELYQRAYIGLVKKGYVVLAYDPISQGERVQIYDPATGESKIGYGTGEHCIQGNQGYLMGVNLAQFRIWDGIRAIDYLCSRDDVDVDRIGCTGNSGGGTLTTYIAALDERVKVAVPCCYITTLKRRMLSRVTADPEQNLIPQIRYGIDHFDWLSLMPPRALQIGSAIQDYFPIEGARETYRALKDTYHVWDIEDRVNMVEVDEQHGFTIGLREGMYAWMNKWFDKADEGDAEAEITVEPDERLQCTETGQVVPSLGGETVFTISKRVVENILPKHPELGSEAEYLHYRDAMREKIAELLAYSHSQTPLNVQTVDTIEREGYSIEKLAYTSEAEVVVPCLLFKPNNVAGKLRAIVYVHEFGKDLDAQVGGQIEELVVEGNLVLAIDPRGVGETKSKHPRGDYYARYGIETDLTYSSFMVGKPLFGMRVIDVVRAVDYLRTRDDIDKISAVGVGMGGLLVMHAAALDERISEVTSENALISYKSLALNEVYDYHVKSFIPNILKYYDMADVAALIAPRKLTLQNTLDHLQQPATQAEIEKEYQWAKQVYALLGVEGNCEFE